MKKKKTSKTVPKRQPARQARARAKAKPQPPSRRRRSRPAAARPRRPSRRPPSRPFSSRRWSSSRWWTPPVDEVIVLETPEPRFASRVLPPEADRPFPVSRRAIFFDVENASRPEHISRVIEHLEVDRTGRRTDFVAVGNWRVIGHDTARLLARHGAHLIHSAPSVGVRDWSDLRIAVGAGVWLAGARRGRRARDRHQRPGLRRRRRRGGEPGHRVPAPVPPGHHGRGGSRAPRSGRRRPSRASARYRGRSRRRGPWRDRPTPGAARSRSPPLPPSRRPSSRLLASRGRARGHCPAASAPRRRAPRRARLADRAARRARSRSCTT